MGKWKPETFTATELAKKLKDKNEIKIPRFQRNLVWSDTQKDTFIDSIKKGYPFGSILLYKDSDGTYQMIDGLQRSNTIRDFINNPSMFFNDSDVEPEVIKQIAKILNLKTNRATLEEKIRNILQDWIKTHKDMEAVERIQYRDFSDELAKEFPTAEEHSKKIANLIKPVLDDFIQVCKDLSKAPIPALIFEGDEKVLPEVFERINSKGTQLSKYQIFAATWSHTEVKVTEKELYPIIDYVNERFESMLQRDYYIQDYDMTEIKKTKKVDVFYLLFGFGKLLTNKFPYLFGKDQGKENVVGEAFTIVNACLGKKTSELRELHHNLLETFDKSNEKINKFLMNILKVIKYVDENLLRGVHKFKGNKRIDSKQSPLHTELQISSIIAATFLLQYGFYTEDKKGEPFVYDLLLDSKHKEWSKQYKKAMKDNLFKIYTMDILQKRWKGSGDKTLNTIVQYPSKYTRTVSWEEFKGSLQNWFNTTKYDRNERKNVKSPREEEKVVLNLLYLKKFSSFDHLSDENFDYEHLATKGLMKNKLEELGEQCAAPISSIGNICLLPETVNRGKREKTLFEDQDYLNKLAIKGISREDLEEKFSLTERHELDWIYKDHSDCEDFREDYMNFLETRFGKMLESLKLDFFRE